MKNHQTVRRLSFYVALAGPLLLAGNALAATPADVASIDNFIKSIIQVIAGLAGLIATGFIVIGGLSYITSSGHPDNLNKAKRTIMFSVIGLAITIGAFVLSDIVTSLATSAFGS